ncbi:MAG: TRAP transporter small permease subunit [Gammaproteobacteria bacterium]
MESFERIHHWLMVTARVAVWMGGSALLLCALMVTVDVVARKLFSVTMSGSDEITGYVFAASTTWAYAYCLLHRSNVRIDALYNVVPKTVRAILDLIGLALLLVYMGYLTVQGYQVFSTSLDRDSVAITTLATPLWIPQLFWIAGLMLFVVTLIFMLAYSLAALLRGDVARVQRIAGALSVQEEIAEDTHGMNARPGNGPGER